MGVLSHALSLCLLLHGPLITAPQGDRPARPAQPSAGLVPGYCEENITRLSLAHNEAGESTLIAIARLGDGEQSRELSRRRLHNVRVYLTEFDWQRPPGRLVTAEGERVKGYGRVEMYVKGMLFVTLTVKRNQDLLVGSCEPEGLRPVNAESNLYPYLDRRVRRRH